MFGKPFTLFRMFGFSVRADWSWLVILVLITTSFLMLFHTWYGSMHYRESTYVLMALVGAFIYFASIVLHELCHSLVARRYGLTMKGITLFLFGGVAEMEGEPASAKVEFLMAAAGPASSVLLTGVFAGLNYAGAAARWPAPVLGILGISAVMNGLLVAFNLIPGFPLDGGRVLRSALWAWKGDLRWATRIATAIGSGFGTLLIFLGVALIYYSPINGIWSILIGFFLRAAAKSGYRQVLIRQALEGEPVRRFMHPEVVSVPPALTLASLVEDYVYRYHYKMFPVVDGDRLVGCVSTRDVSAVPRSEWARRTVGETAGTCSPKNTITPDADALDALRRMTGGGPSRLIVIDDGRLVGIVSLRDLLGFIALKFELDRLDALHPPVLPPVPPVVPPV